MIIGLTGKAGSGKTTFAKMLLNELKEKSAFKTVALTGFAHEVKEIARNSFGWNGEKDEKGRRLLQLIGTECGRAYDEDIWINRLVEKTGHIGNVGKEICIIIDDVRFQNEAKFCIDNGCLIEMIGRAADLGGNATHESEKGCGVIPDFAIDNNTENVDDLRTKARDIVEQILSM